MMRMIQHRCHTRHRTLEYGIQLQNRAVYESSPQLLPAGTVQRRYQCGRTVYRSGDGDGAQRRRTIHSDTGSHENRVW